MDTDCNNDRIYPVSPVKPWPQPKPSPPKEAALAERGPISRRAAAELGPFQATGARHSSRFAFGFFCPVLLVPRRRALNSKPAKASIQLIHRPGAKDRRGGPKVLKKEQRTHLTPSAWGKLCPKGHGPCRSYGRLPCQWNFTRRNYASRLHVRMVIHTLQVVARCKCWARRLVFQNSVPQHSQRVPQAMRSPMARC